MILIWIWALISSLLAIGLLVPILEKRKRVVRIFSFSLFIIALIVAIACFVLGVNSYTMFYSIIITTVAIIIVLSSKVEAIRISAGSMFYSFMAFSIVGIIGLALSNDLPTIFSAWILASMASYGIVAIAKDEESVQGALKYAIMGSVSSTILLLTIILTFSMINGNTFQRPVINLYLIAPTIGLLIAAIGYKVGVFPFHAWLPDTYGLADPILISFVAPLSKAMAILVILKFASMFALTNPTAWFIIFAVFSLLTMFYGNLGALKQKNVQRIMAYSSIAHTGYFLVGLSALAFLSPEIREIALLGLAMQYMAYSFGKSGSFIALASIKRSTKDLSLDSIKGLGKRMKIIPVSFTVLLLSLMGMPPLLGFWGKLYLFYSVAYYAPWLTILALLNTAISVAYYTRIIKSMYFEKGKEEEIKEEKEEAIGVLIAAILTLILGLGIGEYIVKFALLSFNL